MVSIRPAREEDLAAITAIYNEAIENTVATFDTRPKTVEEQRVWFYNHGALNPILVAEVEKHVVGWAALSKWSTRSAYDFTAEISLYVQHKFQGRGIGSALIEEIVQAGQHAGLHSLIARITGGNELSIGLHETVGFEHIGIMREAGYKFGKWLDVHIMQKIY